MRFCCSRRVNAAVAFGMVVVLGMTVSVQLAAAEPSSARISSLIKKMERDFGISGTGARLHPLLERECAAVKRADPYELEKAEAWLERLLADAVNRHQIATNTAKTIFREDRSAADKFKAWDFALGTHFELQVTTIIYEYVGECIETRKGEHGELKSISGNWSAACTTPAGPADSESGPIEVAFPGADAVTAKVTQPLRGDIVVKGRLMVPVRLPGGATVGPGGLGGFSLRSDDGLRPFFVEVEGNINNVAPLSASGSITYGGVDDEDRFRCTGTWEGH